MQAVCFFTAFYVISILSAANQHQAVETVVIPSVDHGKGISTVSYLLSGFTKSLEEPNEVDSSDIDTAWWLLLVLLCL